MPTPQEVLDNSNNVDSNHLTVTFCVHHMFSDYQVKATFSKSYSDVMDIFNIVMICYESAFLETTSQWIWKRIFLLTATLWRLFFVLLFHNFQQGLMFSFYKTMAFYETTEFYSILTLFRSYQISDVLKCVSLTLGNFHMFRPKVCCDVWYLLTADVSELFNSGILVFTLIFMYWESLVFIIAKRTDKMFDNTYNDQFYSGKIYSGKVFDKILIKNYDTILVKIWMKT